MYPLSHDHHHLSNRVTPSGVGQLPESQTRHSQRVQPALSVTAFSRASSPIGRAKGSCAAELHLQMFAGALSAFRADVVSPAGKQPGGQRPPLGSPYGGAGERSANLRGRTQLQIREKYRDCYMVPSQSRLSAVPALPKGEPRAAAPPNCICKCLVVPLSAFCADVVSPVGKQPGR